jgi:Tol biopolymer transport system component
MSYRLIEPAYEVWSGIQIEQRDMENFGSVLLGDNRIADQCCMNCHTSNRNGTSFMHLRGKNGGTVLNRNGHLVKLNTKTEQTGNTVYGDISKDGRYGVFTTADITFAIHSRRDLRMEVYDKRSDLVVVDFDNLTVTDSPATTGDEYQETFPCFSADGRTIFFCRAVHHEQPDSITEMHYDIAVVQFDPETGKMGDRVITIVSASDRFSFSHLKASPDGHWLMATVAEYGTFPVWHKESELWLIDLKTRKIDVLPAINAYGADTYHSWSSNSRWVVFASKRDDLIYGRPYIAYIGPDGTTGKPFVLPQKDPDKYRTTLKSYNLPELYSVPEAYDARDVAAFYNTIEPEQIKYVP